MTKTLLFATGNKNKVLEINQLLNKLPYHIITMKEAGFEEDIPETGSTLKENAIIKAQYLHEKTHKNVIAEDTGLEVDALDGAPGVHTARYAGDSKDPNENMDLLLTNLDGIMNRKARFHTVVALILDDKLYTFEGFAEGNIGLAKSGAKGFGYDPIFIPEGHERTFAEMSMEMKAEISHRGKAVRKLVEFLDLQE